MRIFGGALGCATLVFFAVLCTVTGLAVMGAAGLYYLAPAPMRPLLIAWMEGDVPPDSDVPDRIGTYERVPFDGYEGPISFECTPVAPDAPIHYLTDCFGTPRKGGVRHGGMDFGTTWGSTVVTPWGGKVVWAGWNGPYGVLVVVENQGVQVWLAHNERTLVQVGDIVQAGDPVAVSGNTGNSTGPHVHLEIRVKQDDKVWSVDPDAFTFPGGGACIWREIVPIASNAPAHCRP